MFRIVALLILVVGAVSCGVVGEVRRMLEQQQELSAQVTETIGADAQVGWNWNNGRLTDVTVHLDAEAVAQWTVQDLTDQILPIVLSNFAEITLSTELT